MCISIYTYVYVRVCLYLCMRPRPKNKGGRSLLRVGFFYGFSKNPVITSANLAHDVVRDCANVALGGIRGLAVVAQTLQHVLQSCCE